LKSHGNTENTNTQTHGTPGNVNLKSHGNTENTNTQTHGNTDNGNSNGNTVNANMQTHGNTENDSKYHGSTNNANTQTHGNTDNVNSKSHGNTDNTNTQTHGKADNGNSNGNTDNANTQAHGNTENDSKSHGITENTNTQTHGNTDNGNSNGNTDNGNTQTHGNRENVNSIPHGNTDNIHPNGNLDNRQVISNVSPSIGKSQISRGSSTMNEIIPVSSQQMGPHANMASPTNLVERMRGQEGRGVGAFQNANRASPVVALGTGPHQVNSLSVSALDDVPYQNGQAVAKNNPSTGGNIQAQDQLNQNNVRGDGKVQTPLSIQRFARPKSDGLGLDASNLQTSRLNDQGILANGRVQQQGGDRVQSAGPASLNILSDQIGSANVPNSNNVQQETNVIDMGGGKSIVQGPMSRGQASSLGGNGPNGPGPGPHQVNSVSVLDNVWPLKAGSFEIGANKDEVRGTGVTDQFGQAVANKPSIRGNIQGQDQFNQNNVRGGGKVQTPLSVPKFAEPVLGGLGLKNPHTYHLNDQGIMTSGMGQQQAGGPVQSVGPASLNTPTNQIGSGILPNVRNTNNVQQETNMNDMGGGGESLFQGGLMSNGQVYPVGGNAETRLPADEIRKMMGELNSPVVLNGAGGAIIDAKHIPILPTTKLDVPLSDVLKNRHVQIIGNKGGINYPDESSGGVKISDKATKPKVVVINAGPEELTDIIEKVVQESKGQGSEQDILKQLGLPSESERDKLAGQEKYVGLVNTLGKLKGGNLMDGKYENIIGPNVIRDGRGGRGLVRLNSGVIYDDAADEYKPKYFPGNAQQQEGYELYDENGQIVAYPSYDRELKNARDTLGFVMRKSTPATTNRPTEVTTVVTTSPEPTKITPAIKVQTTSSTTTAKEGTTCRIVQT
jgi:hypothetical protein